ncbi:hypothetical protein AAMO2058_000469900 [Amorphochlora amoebiformis]
MMRPQSYHGFYPKTIPPPPPPTPTPTPTLTPPEKPTRKKKKTDADAIRTLYRVVSNNAFALETYGLGLAYGSAFYQTATYFNHSCDPNCFSMRVAGNMAIYAAKDISKGAELTHSYIRPELLLLGYTDRRAHLFFNCICRRCKLEGLSSPNASAYTPNFKTSPLGQKVGMLKIISASGDDAGVVHKYATALVENKDFKAYSKTHPVALVDITSTVLTNLLQQTQEGNALKVAKYARYWLKLRANSALRLEESKESVTPRGVCRLVWALSTLGIALFSQGLEDNVIPQEDITDAIRLLHHSFASHTHWIREDISFILTRVSEEEKISENRPKNYQNLAAPTGALAALIQTIEKVGKTEAEKKKKKIIIEKKSNISAEVRQRDGGGETGSRVRISAKATQAGSLILVDIKASEALFRLTSDVHISGEQGTRVTDADVHVDRGHVPGGQGTRVSGVWVDVEGRRVVVGVEMGYIDNAQVNTDSHGNVIVKLPSEPARGFGTAHVILDDDKEYPWALLIRLKARPCPQLLAGEKMLFE